AGCGKCGSIIHLMCIPFPSRRSANSRQVAGGRCSPDRTSNPAANSPTKIGPITNDFGKGSRDGLALGEGTIESDFPCASSAKLLGSGSSAEGSAANGVDAVTTGSARTVLFTISAGAPTSIRRPQRVQVAFHPAAPSGDSSTFPQVGHLNRI